MHFARSIYANDRVDNSKRMGALGVCHASRIDCCQMKLWDEKCLELLCSRDRVMRQSGQCMRLTLMLRTACETLAPAATFLALPTNLNRNVQSGLG